MKLNKYYIPKTNKSNFLIDYVYQEYNDRFISITYYGYDNNPIKEIILKSTPILYLTRHRELTPIELNLFGKEIHMIDKLYNRIINGD